MIETKSFVHVLPVVLTGAVVSFTAANDACSSRHGRPAAVAAATTCDPGARKDFYILEGTGSEGRPGSKTAAMLKDIHAPDVIVKAAGAGGQKLYVIPSRNLVVVR